MTGLQYFVVVSYLTLVFGIYPIIIFLSRKVHHMATTLDQLNTAIANLDTQVTGDDATIEAALQLITDDCNQLLNNPPTDFTQQVTSIKATAAKLQSAVDAAKAAAQAEDQKVNPPGPSNAAFPKP